MTLGNVLFIVIAAVVVIVVAWLLFWWLYRRATKELSFVRTGFGGQKVVMNSGAFVLPVLHDLIHVNMNTMRLDVAKAARDSLITRDRMRVDVSADFFIRVKADKAAIAAAAQTLGTKTLRTELLKELLEGRLVDALRSVAAEMSMEELHEKRVEFVRRVREILQSDLSDNGLELQSVSLTSLDQTERDFFNPQNAFDAEGLTRLTQEIEERRRRRNEIEQATEVEIQKLNLTAEQQKLEIARDEEYARMSQEREVALRRAQQRAEIASEEAEKNRATEEARITAKRAVDMAQIQSEQQIEATRIAMEQEVRERDIERDISVELAKIQRSVSIDERSKQQHKSHAEAEQARAEAVRIEEAVATVRELERAERQKQIELIAARKDAEKIAIGAVTDAEAKRKSASEIAAADVTRTEAEAGRIRALAEAESEAERLRSAADEIRQKIDAEARRARHEADSVMSPELIDMRVRLAIIEHLQGIIAESVKPLDNIEGIKIVQFDGLGFGPSNSGTGGGSGGGDTGGLSDQLVSSALRYRAHAPLLDQLLKEIGIDGSDPKELSDSLRNMLRTGETEKAE